MKYYILILYQSKKEENPDVEQGFSRFQPTVRKIIIGCFTVMFLTLIGLIVMMFFLHNIVLYVSGILIFAIAFLIAFVIDHNDQKNNMNRYVDSHKQKIDILYGLLSSEFQINTREKIEDLINMYQAYIDKKAKEEEKRNKFILKISYAFAGVLSFLFVNMEAIGLNLAGWFYLLILLSLCIGCAGICIYSSTFFDTLKKKYEIMIEDLKDLLLIKF